MAKDDALIRRQDALAALHEVTKRHEQQMAKLIVRIEDLETAVEASQQVIRKLEEEKGRRDKRNLSESV